MVNRLSNVQCSIVNVQSFYLSRFRLIFGLQLGKNACAPRKFFRPGQAAKKRLTFDTAKVLIKSSGSKFLSSNFVLIFVKA